MTKKQIVKEIQSRYPTTRCEIGKSALGKGIIEVTECWHSDCERIGQFVLRTFPQVYTYFACHYFRKGRLTIHFKR
jgi:hypothetical protein